MGLSSRRKGGRPWKDELSNLKVIAEYFIKPMMETCPSELSPHVYLEQLFCVRERLIGKFKVKKTIYRVPGLYCESSTIRIQGVGYRRANRDTVLTVRHDITNPDVFDVCFTGGQYNQELWYQMTRSEWLSMQVQLEPMDHEARILRLRDERLE
jgi:hypothetical protein